MTTPPKTRLERAHDWVEAAYAALAATGDFVPRQAQKDLSRNVATALLQGHPLVAEAPTGTGKTIAYLVGALALTESSSVSGQEPILVSTATKALQSQLFLNDLPRLTRAGLLGLDEVAIAKGKSNYVCLRTAEETAALLERARLDPELFVPDVSLDLDYDELAPMLDAFEAGTWDGDFDTWEGRRPKSVFPIAVNSDTCSAKKCPRYSQCAYFSAKARIAGKRIIVANHDLILRDLLLAQQEQASLPAANYFVVFDEAHHLPDKAISVGSTEADLAALQRALPKLAGLQKLLKTGPEVRGIAERLGLKEEVFDRTAVTLALREVVGMLSVMDVDEDSGQKRFAKGQVPQPLMDALIALTEGPLAALCSNLAALVGALKDASLPASAQDKASEAMRRALDVKRLGDEVLVCVFRLQAERTAKWMFRRDGALSLHTAPLEGSDVLDRLLWQNSRTRGVVMVSATLRDIGGFSRFKRRAGLPETTAFEVLPYTFAYKESRLVVASMRATPKPAERKHFLEELRGKLPEKINPREGTLVLFPSWSMTREFAPLLKARFGEQRVKAQGEHPVRTLVNRHKSDVDAGYGSVLVGVATLSEGLDLPGDYCTHVVIVALPFAVPSDPVEQELSDILGPKYFSERSLPDATVRLTQMVGRLLRRESDRGRVTVFDRRLASTSYGKQMLNSLPPFEKVIEPA